MQAMFSCLYLKIVVIIRQLLVLVLALKAGCLYKKCKGVGNQLPAIRCKFKGLQDRKQLIVSQLPAISCWERLGGDERKVLSISFSSLIASFGRNVLKQLQSYFSRGWAPCQLVLRKVRWEENKLLLASLQSLQNRRQPTSLLAVLGILNLASQSI